MKLLRLEINPNRVYGLDILRALAIFFVVLGHSTKLVPKELEKVMLKFGYFDGVSVFFVLSGFLIGHILIKNIEANGLNKYSLLNFWIRRWFRTLPNFYFILFLLTLIEILKNSNFSIYSIRYYIIFSQNLFSGHPSFFPEAWSLSVEEWFYLIIPICIFIFIKVFNISAKKTVLVVATLVLILITLIRFYKFNTGTIEHYYEWDLLFRKQVSTRLDSLMYGVIGAYIMFYYKSTWNKYKLSLFIIGLALMLVSKFILDSNFNISTMYTCVFSFSLFSFATLLLLPFLSSYKSKKKNFTFHAITYISLISYSMYLINLSLIRKNVITPLQEIVSSENGWITFGIYFLFWFLTVVISILIYKHIEIPLMKLRDHRFFTKRTS